MIIYVIVNYTQSIDAGIYIHIHDKMKTPEQAIKMHEDKFETKRIEFDKIIDEAIDKNFDISKGIVEVKDNTAVGIYNMFQDEVNKYCQQNGRNITLGKYDKQDMRGESYNDKMLVLKPKSETKTNNIDYHTNQRCTCNHEYKTGDSRANFKVGDMK